MSHLVLNFRCIEHTNGKAIQEGAIICALVNVGRMKKVSAPDSEITLQKLNASGYDSVYARAKEGFLSRDEFVVYKTDRVKQWVIVYPTKS